jgi:Tetracyclin repressor-like, C-terminal domain
MPHPDDARLVLPAGAAVPARIPAGIFAAAADTFVAGQRLDMRSLARRLGVARGMAGALEKLIDLERGRGSFDASLDTPTLAYAILRISEGFLYSDVIADRTPDIDRATTVIEGLLTGLDRRSAPV